MGSGKSENGLTCKKRKRANFSTHFHFGFWIFLNKFFAKLAKISFLHLSCFFSKKCLPFSNTKWNGLFHSYKFLFVVIRNEAFRDKLVFVWKKLKKRNFIDWLVLIGFLNFFYLFIASHNRRLINDGGVCVEFVRPNGCWTSGSSGSVDDWKFCFPERLLKYVQN